MKRIDYIAVILSLATALAGCEKQTEVSGENIIPTAGYIHFNTEVASRGTLVTAMEGKEFVVTGYNYTGDWNTVKVQAKPNVFHGQSVTWDASSSLHTYTPIQPWEAGMKYSFFAHYPNSSNITLSGETYEGTPYIIYTLPNDVADMADVMTACLYDTDNSSSNTVGLTFKHRLVAVDVQARNFNDPIDNGTEVHIKISSLNIAFSNLMYNQVTLPLDASLAIERSAGADWNPTSAAYDIIPTGKSVTVAPTNTNSSNDASTGISGGFNTTLIVIPQEAETGSDGEVTGLKGTLTVTYEYVDSSGNSLTIDNKNRGTEAIPFDVGKDMVAGRKYHLQMTFSRSAITIAIIESGVWEDKDVEIEFE